ncbi:MAG TPA: sugar nucleotide-binding protein, partial [Acidimicrobiia bacterium]|nr:sugar nucleotide-binding protein [Acidimicrobiia bacterium]
MAAHPLRILVTGAGGQVGSEVAAHLPHHEVMALDRAGCDLADRHSVEQ